MNGLSTTRQLPTGSRLPDEPARFVLVAFTVVPLHSLSLPAGTRIPFGNGFVLQNIPAWVKNDKGILSGIHNNDRQLIEDDKHALIAEYEADGIGFESRHPPS
jgi:sporulation-control protein spo0M